MNKTRLITIEYEEYLELLQIKEAHEENMKLFDGKKIILEDIENQDDILGMR